MVKVVCGIIQRLDGAVLVAKRPVGKHLAGKWEFPGGKLEKGEGEEKALRRELLEELGCRVNIVVKLHHSHHTYEHGIAIEMIPIICELMEGSDPPTDLEHEEIRWVVANEIGAYDLAEADLPVWEEFMKWKMENNT